VGHQFQWEKHWDNTSSKRVTFLNEKWASRNCRMCTGW
jgi:hypothetical protein